MLSNDSSSVTMPVTIDDGDSILRVADAVVSNMTGRPACGFHIGSRIGGRSKQSSKSRPGGAARETGCR